MSHDTHRPTGFSIPTTSPLYEGPPVEYQDSRLLCILFKTTPQTIHKLVPRPLVPNPDHLMLLVVNLLQSDRFGPYNEVGLTVPAAIGQTIGQYCAYLYVDNDAAIAAGREIWGFPKKRAQIRCDDVSGSVNVSVNRAGVDLIEITLVPGEIVPLEQLPLHPYSRWLDLKTWFNHKLIPSVEKGAPPVVNQLTATTMENLTFSQVRKGKGAIIFGTSPVDPLYEIDKVELVDGFSIQAHGILTYGEIIHDYLAQNG